MIGEYLTIDQFEHTKLIGHYVTLSTDTILIDVCFRTIIAQQEYTIVFDALYQCPQTNEVRITLKVLRVNVTLLTDASIDLFCDLCCFLIRNKRNHCGHLAGKLHHLFNISKRSLSVRDVGIGFYEQDRISAVQVDHQGQCPTVAQIVVCFVYSVRSNDNVLRYYLRELVGDGVGFVFLKSTKPNEVTLNDRFSVGEMIKAGVKNLCHVTIIKEINLFVIVGDLNLYFVEDTFGANEELTSCWVGAPNNSGSAVNLNTESATINEPVQNIKVAREDGIFGVFEVFVLHVLSMAGSGGFHKGVCATKATGTRAAEQFV
jgi:hypothetical protein